VLDTLNIDIHNERILILDFGSQYTQLIARRIREIGVYCELYPYDVDEKIIQAFKPKGIILSGSHESVTEGDTPRAPALVFDIGVPVLGICYGKQTMASQVGGKVESSDKREFGYAELVLENHCQLFDGAKERDQQGKVVLDVWMSHGDKVTQLPDGFSVVASTLSAPISAMANEEKHFYALQFHPEVTHTNQGGVILQNFVKSICQCQAIWNSENIVTDMIARVREQVGKD